MFTRPALISLQWPSLHVLNKGKTRQQTVQHLNLRHLPVEDPVGGLERWVYLALPSARTAIWTRTPPPQQRTSRSLLCRNLNSNNAILHLQAHSRCSPQSLVRHSLRQTLSDPPIKQMQVERRLLHSEARRRSRVVRRAICLQRLEIWSSVSRSSSFA